MANQQILVLGGGFAGLWSAVGAMRKLVELNREDDVDVTLVNRDPYHSIRVRNYEDDLSQVRVPLAEVLDPIGVRPLIGEVEQIDLRRRQVAVSSPAGLQQVRYDRLVFALGSRVVRPDLAGAEWLHDVDTYGGARRLESHLQQLSTGEDWPGRWTVVVVGAGLTGVETACELPARLERLRAQSGSNQPIRVILVDHNPRIGSDMGDAARPVIQQALGALGIESRVDVRVTAVDAGGVTFDGGERIDAATVVWCAGLRANPLAAQFPVEHDRFGRVAVDEFMRVVGVPGVFAAGDVANARIDGQRPSVMSCQHGRPMGRFAGHNVVCDLLGLPMLPLSIDWYVTVLDLGPQGAVYTNGWDRHVVAQGQIAKRTKQTINCERIYPPRSGKREEILAAAAPVVQEPPDYER